MSNTVEGIVLSKRKHTNSSLIVTVLTENGLMSFYYRGGEKKAQHLFPMASGTVIYNQNSRSELHNMSSFELEDFQNFIQDPRRVAIAFFTSELLLKCTAEHNPDAYLFAQSKHILKELNVRSPKTLPLFVLLELTDPLGIRIDGKSETNYAQVVDLHEGKIVHGSVSTTQTGVEALTLISNYLRADFEHKYDRAVYRQAVRLMLQYYAEHFPGVARMKSVEVLYETMA